MTDFPLVAKKLARIEACLHDLRTQDTSALAENVVVERFVEHTLQVAIQAVIDVCAHVVADNHLGEPTDNHALLELMARDGWLPAEQVATLHRIVGFRNVLVHDYDTVDLAVVKRILDHHLVDFERFVAAVRARLATV